MGVPRGCVFFLPSMWAPTPKHRLCCIDDLFLAFRCGDPPQSTPLVASMIRFGHCDVGIYPKSRICLAGWLVCGVVMGAPTKWTALVASMIRLWHCDVGTHPNAPHWLHR